MQVLRQAPRKSVTFRAGLIHTFHTFDFGNLFFQNLFDAVFQGHLRHGAALTGALQTHFYGAVFDTYQFYISAVRLQRRTYFVDYGLDFIVHIDISSPGTSPRALFIQHSRNDLILQALQGS